MVEIHQPSDGGGGGAVDSVNGQTGVVVLDTGDIADTLNKRYVTDAQLAVIGNTSGTNTGDNATNSQYSGLAASKANVAGSLTQFVGNTPWRVFYSDTAGDITELALGADGTFLKSNGASVAPSFATPAGSGDVSKVGTPVNNQVGVWTGDGTIEGDANLTFDTATDTLTSVNINATTFTGALTGTASGNLTSANIVATITNGDTTHASSSDALFDALALKEPLKGADDNYVTDAQLVVIGNTSGTNTGDQTSIVGITGTKAQFDTAVTDGNFLYVGDVTQYTDEMAQDAVGNAVGNGLDYDDTTGAISVDETELVHNSLGSKQGGTAGEYYHLTSAQHTVVGNTSGTNTGDNAVNSLYSGLVTNATHTGDATGATALTLATVNTDVGTFGSSTSIPTFTVNGKGLITAASGNAVVAPAGTLTGTTLASGVVTSSLTAVGTIATGVWNATDIAVADGGTGRSTSTTAYGLIAAGTTATGAHQTLAAGATTEILVGGGTSALPVWTTATGTGAPVRAGSPTFTTQITTPLIYGSAASGGDLVLASTSNATKGMITIGSGETTGQVGIGNDPAAGTGLYFYKDWSSNDATATAIQFYPILETTTSGRQVVSIGGQLRPAAAVAQATGFGTLIQFGAAATQNTSSWDVTTLTGNQIRVDELSGYSGTVGTLNIQNIAAGVKGGTGTFTTMNVINIPAGHGTFGATNVRGIHSAIAAGTNIYGLYFDGTAQNYLAGNLGIVQATPTAYLHLGAGTAAASTAPLKFDSGTVNTASEAGAMEFDGKVFYQSPIASARAVNIGTQYSIVPAGGFALSTAAGVQSCFPTTGDVWTLAASTTYKFEGFYHIQKATNSVTIAMAFALAGGASITSMKYHVFAQNAAVNTTGATLAGTYVDRVASTVVCATSTANTQIRFNGIIRMNAGGTVTPQINFSGTAAGTPTMMQDSYIMFTPIGTNTQNIVGNVG